MVQPSDGLPRTYTITEQGRVPWLSVLFGYGPMLPIAAGAALSWCVTGNAAELAIRITLIFAGTILAFLSGVRRGLSFRAPKGETVPQLVTMLWLFVLALASLGLGDRPLSSFLLIIGFGSVAVFDVLAARREEAPPYFARLRPPQMGIAVVSLVVMLIRQSIT